MDGTLENSLLRRLLVALMQAGMDADSVRSQFILILQDFNISPKEEALAVYHEGKNEVYIKNFLAVKMVAGCTKKTIEMYGTTLSRTFDEIGKDVDTITHRDIQIMFAKKLQNGSSKVYCNNIRRTLSTFYNWMSKEGLIRKNPIDMVELIKEPKKKKKAFTDMDIEKLRGGCRTNRERAIIEMLLSTGCRVSELANIKLEDITGTKISIIGKGQKQRYVYLNARAEYALQNYLSERTDKNPYLFPRMSDDAHIKAIKGDVCRRPEWYKTAEYVDPVKPLDKGTLESITRSMGKRVGVEDAHPHRFRRTCATFALNRGMPLARVSQMLGHENIATTQIYLDLDDTELEQDHRKYVV